MMCHQYLRKISFEECKWRVMVVQRRQLVAEDVTIEEEETEEDGK